MTGFTYFCNLMTYFKSIIFSFFLFFVFNIKGQQIIGPNLNNNPSFENYYSCPGNEGELYKCKTWCGLSCDYYNNCSYPLTMGVPQNGQGFQYAHSGVAYAGAIIYMNDWRKYRETIKTTISNI